MQLNQQGCRTDRWTRAGRALLMAAACTAAAGMPACGGDSSDDDGSSGATGAAAAGGSSGGACVPADCPDVSAFNTMLPGCCQLNGACGALLSLMGTSFCGPPDVGDLAGDLSERFSELPVENIDPDPVCPDQVFFGTQLDGCCDASGVCGLSTAGLNAGTAALFLGGNVPASCVAPEEAASLGAGADQVFSGQSQACTP